jgi:hypothetical protein
MDAVFSSPSQTDHRPARLTHDETKRVAAQPMQTNQLRTGAIEAGSTKSMTAG